MTGTKKTFMGLEREEIAGIKSKEFREKALGRGGVGDTIIYAIFTILIFYFGYNYIFESQGAYLSAKDTAKTTYGEYIFCASKEKADLFLQTNMISKNFSIEEHKKCQKVLSAAKAYGAKDESELINEYALTEKSLFQKNQLKNLTIAIGIAIIFVVYSLRPIDAEELEAFDSRIEIEYSQNKASMIKIGGISPAEEVSEEGALFMIDAHKYDIYYVLEPLNPGEEIKAVMYDKEYSELKKFLSQFKNITFKQFEDKWEVIYLEYKG